MKIKISVIYVDGTTDEFTSPLGLTNSKTLARMVALERCDVQGVNIISEETGEILWQGEIVRRRDGYKDLEDVYDPYYQY